MTIVFQGGLSKDTDIRYTADYTRDVFPGASLILATQEAELRKLGRRHGFDEVVATPDPGSLPPVKLNGAPHNANRQIASAISGLAIVKTPFAMKIRTDAFLGSRRILDRWSAWQDAPPGPTTVGESRILAASFFTVNPRYDERLLYHVSDWIHFGRTADLVRFFNCPKYNQVDATWYETRPYSSGSLPREREFRSRLSTEQWLTLNYLFQSSSFPISYHNQYSASLIREFEETLVDNFIIVHPHDIDFVMPKHRWVFKSTYFNTLCYSYLEWAKTMQERRGHVRELDGYSQWPRTGWGKRAYMQVRTGKSMRWISRLPGGLGKSLHQRFFAWD